MIGEGKSMPLSPIYVWAITEEYFSINQTCQLLRINARRIRQYVAQDDSMPFRCFPGQQRGAFIYKDDLRAWLKRNTVMRHDEKTFLEPPET